MDSKIVIEHSNNNGKEFGYGIYINGVSTFSSGGGVIWASECLPKDAADERIKAAEHRVRRLARDRQKREVARC